MKSQLIAIVAAVVLVTTAFAGPIHTAAEKGDLARVQKELDKGVDVNATKKDGTTPLHHAAWEGHKEIVELLIAKGADVNAKSDDGYTPLHDAAWEGQKEIAELLINAGADVNAKNDDGTTPLHYAIDDGHKEIVELLIANSADVNANEGWVGTPLDWAEPYEDDSTEDKAARKEIADLLRKHGGNTGEELQTLLDAAANGDFEAVKQAIADGADVNAKDSHGNTPLH